jgi:hypothetical protein
MEKVSGVKSVPLRFHARTVSAAPATHVPSPPPRYAAPVSPLRACRGPVRRFRRPLRLPCHSLRHQAATGKPARPVRAADTHFPHDNPRGGSGFWQMCLLQNTKTRSQAKAFYIVHERLVNPWRVTNGGAAGSNARRCLTGDAWRAVRPRRAESAQAVVIGYFAKISSTRLNAFSAAACGTIRMSG